MPEPRSPSPVPSSPRDGGSLSDESPSGPAAKINPRICPKCSGRYPADFRVCPRDATPLEDATDEAEDPVLGQTLSGTYEILRVIGEGGMGRVYEARHSRLSNKRYAIKMLHQELSRQPEVVTRFQREAEAASGLSHPNVVGVFDVNTAPDGRPYMVAELLEGEQFGDYLDRAGKLSVTAAVPIVRQVCRALTKAHEQGIVHRDVKPENVFLLRGEGGVKVLDFGISKFAEGNSSLTKTGMVMGTPDYMAPEQARGDCVDARADIYAVGAILYRAVTGRKPFQGLDPMQTLTAALVQEPPRPSSLESSIPLALESLIQRAMAKEPKERFQTMVELDEALAAFDTSAGVLPTLEGMPTTIDVVGNTVISHPGLTPPSRTVQRRAESARLARPALAFFTVLGSLWLVTNVVIAVAAFIRQLRGAELTAYESVLLPVGAIAAAVTPAVVWVRFITREVWPNTPRAVEMGERLRRTVLYSASAYGITGLAVHLFEDLIHRDAAGSARAAWALLMFCTALTTAIATWTLTRPKR